MKQTILFLCLCAAALTGCHNSLLPRNPTVPIRSVNDAEDELLHDRCAVKGVTTASYDQIESTAQAAGANFVELMYRENGQANVVMFACQGTPPNVGKQPSDVTE